MKLLIILTSVLLLTACGSESAKNDALSKDERSGRVCEPTQLIDGCELPKPSWASRTELHPTHNAPVCMDMSGVLYVSSPYGQLRLDAVQAIASGGYKTYGCEYYAAYPLRADASCPAVNFNGAWFNLCFE